MPIVKFSMSYETLQALKVFILDKYGVKRGMSIIVEEAVREYLERETKGKREG